MIHPIPPGTRDVLPDEMRELRRLHLALIEVFESRGYGEVATPAIEYDEVLARGDGRTAGGAYRFFDERGDLLALRSDMTVPIARLVATRYASAEPPLRLCYLANAYRAVRPQRGQMREFAQAGVELIGAPAPQGTAEVVEVLEAALDAAGLTRAVIGLGDADLYRQLLAELGVAGEARDSILERLAMHDLVGLEAELSALEGISEKQCATCVALSQLRGGSEVLEQARGLGGAAVERATARIQETFEALQALGVADRVRIDLGLLRDLGYYSGAILEVYDPALGHVLGGGGRYDESAEAVRPRSTGGRLRPLLGAGPRRPDGGGVEARGGGFVSVEVAGLGRAKVDGPLKLAVPRGALFGETLDALDAAGIDTAVLRGNSRSLIFEGEDITLVTMRPSDVPTYVEAGAADVGITGKDVLLEQADRVVYELLDLGFGRCRMVLAGRKGDERLGESERRLGMMRIATKYPRIAERHFERTGRQVEVIEVKGSVELAPLIGLADGIVDLVATGRTLEENDLEVREEILDCTARFVANRVAHKLRAAEVDALTAKLKAATAR